MTSASAKHQSMKERLQFLLTNPAYIIIAPILRIPYFRFLRETSTNPHPITFRIWFFQKILGFNKQAYWPMHFTSKVVEVQNIQLGVGTYPGYNPGVYIQGTGKLIIGNYTHVGQNSGILSGGHDIHNHLKLTKSETVIGDYCWIGMNAIVLPGVQLGKHTIVAAGSIVTKSFKTGYVVIGGNPARIIRKLDAAKMTAYEYPHKYIGYYRKQAWEKKNRTCE